MRNITTIFFILFTLCFHQKNHAQSIDFDNFYIEAEDELNGVRRSQIKKVLNEFKIALLEDLENRGGRVPNRTFYENFVPAKLQGFDVKYNPEMDKFIFGKARYIKSNDQLIITTYLYDIVKEENRTRLSAVTYNVNDNFLNVCTSEQTYVLLAADTNNKLFSSLPQQDVPPRFPETDNRPAETVVKPTTKPKRTPSSKKNKPSKEKRTPPASTKSCSKAPAVVVIGAGALMGGAGVYLRQRALKIYDEDYRPIVGSLDSDTELDRARRPNQVAHMVGATGILTAGLGIYLWARCSKRNKRAKLGLHDTPRFEVTPEVQYDSFSNTNTLHTKLTYHF